MNERYYWYDRIDSRILEEPRISKESFQLANYKLASEEIELINLAFSTWQQFWKPSPLKIKEPVLDFISFNYVDNPTDENTRLRIEPNPPRNEMKVNYNIIVKSKPQIDLSNYPHKCPRCTLPAYIGFTKVDCSNMEYC